jgi:hypothetical protein
VSQTFRRLGVVVLLFGISALSSCSTDDSDVVPAPPGITKVDCLATQFPQPEENVQRECWQGEISTSLDEYSESYSLLLEDQGFMRVSINDLPGCVGLAIDGQDDLEVPFACTQVVISPTPMDMLYTVFIMADYAEDQFDALKSTGVVPVRYQVVVSVESFDCSQMEHAGCEQARGERDGITGP